MSAEQNKASVRQVFEAAWQGDFSLMEAHPGLHEIIPTVAAIREGIQEPRFEVMEQLSDGNWVITRATTAGYMTGEWMGQSFTDEYMVSEVIMMHRFENGVIVEQHSQGGRIG